MGLVGMALVLLPVGASILFIGQKQADAPISLSPGSKRSVPLDGRFPPDLGGVPPPHLLEEFISRRDEAAEA
jgi:hypothetical protein